MKNSKHIINLLVFVLIGSNLIWLVDKYRSYNREMYNATYSCEQNELIYCLQTFEIGTSYNTFKMVIEKRNFELINMWDTDGHRYVTLKDILMPCPKSNRPYCGILFTFKNLKLAHIEIGYPCH